MKITIDMLIEIEKRLKKKFSTENVKVFFSGITFDNVAVFEATIDDTSVTAHIPGKLTADYVADDIAWRVELVRETAQPPKPGTGGIGIEAPRMTVGTRNGVYDYQQVWIPEECIDMIAAAVVKKLEERRKGE